MFFYLADRFEDDNIKRSNKRATVVAEDDEKPNKRSQVTGEDDDDMEETEIVKKLPGQMVFFAKENIINFEICVACFLNIYDKCVNKAEPIPPKLFGKFAWAQVRAPCMLIRNHKNLCYNSKRQKSTKKCCDPEDNRVVNLSIPWIRQFDNDTESDNTESIGNVYINFIREAY